MQHMVVVVPVNRDIDETEHVAEEHWRQLEQSLGSDGVIAVISTDHASMKIRAVTAERLARAAPCSSATCSVSSMSRFTGTTTTICCIRCSGDGWLLWANLHLLFWLSLSPSPPPGWRKPVRDWPTFLYGLVLLLTAIAYFILQTCVIHTHGADSLLAKAIGADLKGRFLRCCTSSQSRSDSSRPGWRLQFTLRWR